MRCETNTIQMRLSITTYQEEEIIRLYSQEKIGMKAITKRLSISSPGVVRRCLTRNNVEIRSEKEGKAVSVVFQKKWDQIRIDAAERNQREKEEAKQRAKQRAKQKQERDSIKSTPLFMEAERIKRNKACFDRYHSNEQTRQRDIWRSRLSKVIYRRLQGPAQWMGAKDADEIIIHIESLWEIGMSWENYGRSAKGQVRWQVDHIIPVDLFDLTCPNQAAECWHYNNFQPLWWWKNIRKGAKHPTECDSN